MHAVPRGSFDFPPSRRHSVSSSSLNTICSTCFSVEEDIRSRILSLSLALSSTSSLYAGRQRDLLPSDVPRTRCHHSCVHLRDGSHRTTKEETSTSPSVTTQTARAQEEGEEESETGVDLNLIMDGRDSVASVDLGDGGLAKVPDFASPKKVTQRSVSDAGAAAGSKRLLGRSNTVRKAGDAAKETSVDDAAVAYDSNSEEPMQSRVRKYFRLPRLEFRDHVPFQPPAHSVGAPRNQGHDSNTTDQDQESRLDSSTQLSTVDVEPQSLRDHDLSPPVSLKRYQTLRLEDAIDQVIHDIHPAATRSPLRDQHASMIPRPNARHVPGSYRTEYAPTPLAEEVPAREPTPVPQDLAPKQRQRSLTTRIGAPLRKERQQSFTGHSLRSQASDSSLNVPPLFSPVSLLSRASASTQKHPLLKASVAQMSIDRGLPVSTVLTPTTVAPSITATTRVTAAGTAAPSAALNRSVSAATAPVRPRRNSALIISTPTPPAAAKTRPLSSATSVASLRQVFGEASPAYSHPGSSERVNSKTPASISVYSEQSQTRRVSDDGRSIKAESPYQSRRVSDGDEATTSRIDSVVTQSLPGGQEVTVSRTESEVVSKPASKATSRATSVHSAELVGIQVVHTLKDDLVLAPTTVPALGKSPTKAPQNAIAPAGGYRHMVAESIIDAAKRAEAYLHGHAVHSESEPAVKAASEPQSRVSTQSGTRKAPNVEEPTTEDPTTSGSDVDDEAQDAAVLIMSASGKNSRQASGAEHRRGSATPSSYSLMVPVKEESPFTDDSADYDGPDFAGFGSQESPDGSPHIPMPREMNMSTPMPQGMPETSPARTPQRVDEHVPGYREMVTGTIINAAKQAEAYIHGHELRTVEPVPEPPSHHSSKPSSKPSTQPQTRYQSRAGSYEPTSPAKTIPENDIVPLSSAQISFSPPPLQINSPMKSATMSPPRRPSSVVSVISAALSRVNQSSPSYERLPADSPKNYDSEDNGNTTDVKENEHHESNSWKTMSSKSLRQRKQPNTGPSKKSSLNKKKARSSVSEAVTQPVNPPAVTRVLTNEPTPIPKNKASATQFAKKLRSMSTDQHESGEITPTPERPHLRPALSDAARNSASAVSDLLDKSKLRNQDKHHRTVHWLKELLSSQGSSPTQLTAFPPRTHRASRGSRGSVHIPMPPPEPHDITAIREDLKKSREENGEAFNKTIEDLETLLSEALQIARNAAEKDEGQVRRTASDSVQSAAYGGNAEGRSYGLSGARPRLRSAVSVPHELGSVHESGRSSSSSSLVSHPSDVYPEKYHSAVLATSDAPRGIVVQNVIVDEAPTWRRLPAPITTQSAKRGSMAVSREGMPKPASKAEFKKMLMNPPLNNGFLNDNSARIRINSRGETRKVTAYMSNLAKDFPPPVAKRLSTNIERRPSPLSYFTTDAASLMERDRPISPILKPASPIPRPANVDFDSILAANKINQDMYRNQSGRKSSKTSKVDPLSAKSSNRKKAGVKALLPSTHEVKSFINIHHEAPIPPRKSSLKLRRAHAFPKSEAEPEVATLARSSSSGVLAGQLTPSAVSLHSLDGPRDHESESEIEFVKSRKHRFNSLQRGRREGLGAASGMGGSGRGGDVELRNFPSLGPEPTRSLSGRKMRFRPQSVQLRGLSHVSLDKRHGFSLARSHRRQPIARDWSVARKRFSATIACISTGLIGVLVGIYAGMVPSIQYYIADFHHYAILGNVFFYIGLAIPTMFFWPLPLLHGRKPYILASMALAMPLLFPQAIAVGVTRSPYIATYRVGLILPRAFMGVALGFANMNFHSILTDLFGASLQSSKPHQELVTLGDVRRHGGGLGVWLGIWTWCFVGSIGVGFLIGASIINTLSPDWGFYVCIIIIAGVLLLNVITPEVRRSAYRRSVTEVRTKDDISRRLARGEVMMHRVQTGPKWWGEEVYHGFMLSTEMVRQPGFAVMTLYVGWTYAQIVLVIVLLGSLMSKYYRFTSPRVGAATMAIPIGALFAVPFQKASVLSRSRKKPQRTDSNTFDKRVTWSSHLIRRSIFTLTLPFASMAYTLSSEGPPIPFILPILFAGLIGFLSSLAIAECTGIIMETFDTSDLQPGMTGRPRGPSGERTAHKRTNYSSFPRVSAGMGICQGIGFLFAAAATAVGGATERRIGQRAATGVMAGILLFLTVLLLCVLIRFKEVQIIPDSKRADMERYEKARRRSVNELSAIAGNPGVTAQDYAERVREVEEEEEMWRPVIIGNPSGRTRRMSLLELGGMSRWSEIRRRNKLVDEGLEARHPNLAAMGSVKGRLKEKGGEAREGLSRRGRSLREKTRERSEVVREAIGGRMRSGRSYMSGTDERKGVTLTDGPAPREEEGEQSEAFLTDEERQNERVQQLRSDSRGGYDRV